MVANFTLPPTPPVFDAFVPNTHPHPDIIQLTSDNVTMSEKDISWESDRTTRFKQPPGFTFKECSLETSCTDCLGSSQYMDCKNYTDPVNNTDYKFWYPNDDKVGVACVRERVGGGGGGREKEGRPAGVLLRIGGQRFDKLDQSVHKTRVV